MTHYSIIQLMIAYTLVGALIFTVIITCLSLLGVVKFANQDQQNKLFHALVIESVIIAISFFANVLEFNPAKVEGIIRSDLSPSQVIEKYYFNLNEGNKSIAYDFLSKEFKESNSLAEYERNFSFWDVGHVKPWDEEIDGKTAKVKINLRCFNVDSLREHWSGTINLVKEENGWRIQTMQGLEKHQR